MGCHFLLQGIFPTNQWIEVVSPALVGNFFFKPLSHQGSLEALLSTAICLAPGEHFTGINLLNPWNNPCEIDVIMKVVFRRGKINLWRSLINHPKSYNCKCLTWGLELRHFMATHDHSGTSPCAWHSWGGFPRHTEVPTCHSSHSTLVSFSTACHMLW